MKIVYPQRAITSKVGKPELRFMCSASQIMMFNICVKFHENMSSGFKVMEQTRKLLTHKGNNCLMMFNICVKFHENMSSSFKVMERTQKVVNTQRAITPKVGKPELWFLHSVCRLMVFNVCVKFHSFIKICQVVLNYGADTKIVNTQRAITPKVGKPKLRFMCSARPLMVF